jgi:hypothetical protein
MRVLVTGGPGWSATTPSPRWSTLRVRRRPPPAANPVHDPAQRHGIEKVSSGLRIMTA